MDLFESLFFGKRDHLLTVGVVVETTGTGKLEIGGNSLSSFSIGTCQLIVQLAVAGLLRQGLL